MENSCESPLKSPIKTKNLALECNTPSAPPTQDPMNDQNFQSSGTEKLGKIGTLDRLKVPKAFKYPERYRSPTDSMMSPVSKGLLLAKNRKGSGVLLPQSLNHTKIQDVDIKDARLLPSRNVGTLFYQA